LDPLLFWTFSHIWAENLLPFIKGRRLLYTSFYSRWLLGYSWTKGVFG